jgi:16S rRNA (uracil1498-N3)-methyltransferase
VQIPTNNSNKAPRHFVQTQLEKGQTVKLPSETSHHIGRVTRMRTGDTITLFNGDGFFYHGTLCFEGKNDCTVTITEAERSTIESPLEIALLQGLASSEKMAWAIEKATELGVSRVIPVECHRSVAQLSVDKVEKKQQHWLNIARAASAQCGRAKVPTIEAPISSCNSSHFKAIVSQFDGLLVLSPVESLSLSTWAHERFKGLPDNAANSKPSRLAIYIGPEGGLDETEIKFAIEHGFQAIRIGPRVLRTETAGPTVIAALQALLGDF